MEKTSPEQREKHLESLLMPMLHSTEQFDLNQVEWIESLEDHLNHLATLRIDHVREWLGSNTTRFNQDLPQLQEVYRAFDAMVVALKSNIKLCGLQCANCQLACISSYHHEGPHDCRTSHTCPHQCNYAEAHIDEVNPNCGLP